MMYAESRAETMEVRFLFLMDPFRVWIGFENCLGLVVIKTLKLENSKAWTIQAENILTKCYILECSKLRNKNLQIKILQHATNASIYINFSLNIISIRQATEYSRMFSWSRKWCNFVWTTILIVVYLSTFKINVAKANNELSLKI